MNAELATSESFANSARAAALLVYFSVGENVEHRADAIRSAAILLGSAATFDLELVNGHAVETVQPEQTEPDFDMDALEIELAEATAPLAVVRFMQTIGRNGIDRGEHGSARIVLIEALRKYGHTDSALQGAIRTLVKSGVLAETKVTPKTRRAESINLVDAEVSRYFDNRKKDKVNRGFPSAKSSSTIDFTYADVGHDRRQARVTRGEFMQLPFEIRALIIVSRFQGVRFGGISVEDRILKSARAEDGEDFAQILDAGLIKFGDNLATLTPAGHERLRDFIFSEAGMSIRTGRKR